MKLRSTLHQTTRPKNRSFVILVLALLLFGILVITDATLVYSTNVYGNPYKFVLLQIAWIIIGLIGFMFFYKQDYRKIGKIAFIIMLVDLVFLGLLALASLLNLDFAFFPKINGAHRWFYLNPSPLPKLPFIGVIGFQPGELAKICLILYLSFQLSKFKDTKTSSRNDPLYFFFIFTAIVSGLVMLQPNMSTAVMLFAIGSMIYFSSGFEIKKLFTLAPALMLFLVLLVLISPYRRDRLVTLLKGDNVQDRTTGYHMKQILISLGTGGFWGVGLGQSKQKYQYLPEIASDSIFAVIGEEFGFIGTTAVILVFGYFIYKGLTIAKKTEDLLGRLIAVGVTSWIGLQFFVNVAAMAKIIPLTGVPIPLISYGGSSMVFTLMGLGVLANIDKSN